MKLPKKFTLSFECFPPKTPQGVTSLQKTASTLLATNPDFFSVTFGAGGSTQKGTIETVQALQNMGIKVAPHIACTGLSRDEIIAILRIYQSLNITQLVALRGDLPSGMGRAGELRYASDLVALIREVTHDTFHIDVAAYPEAHPQANNALDDIRHLKKKMDLGANGAITQYFFNPDAYLYFRDACLSYGITIPIVPGIMPIQHFYKLVRFSEMCGAEIPRWLRKRFEAYGDDQLSIQQLGLEVVFKLCETLLQHEVPGLHFYTLNQSEPSISLTQMLGLHKRVAEQANQYYF